MRKKQMLLVAAAALLGLLSGSVILFLTRARMQPTSQDQAVTPTGVFTTTHKLLTWDDPAGFTFQYPADLNVDEHPEDQVNYAHVELTNPNYPGHLIVWAKDTTAADSSAWAKTEKQFAGSSILDATLGKQPAKKILLTTPEKKLVTGTIYDELLFMIEVSADESGYWSDINETVSSSFAFKPILQGEANESESGSEESVEEEEVIE